MAYGLTLRPESTGLFCTEPPLCDTDTDTYLLIKIETYDYFAVVFRLLIMSLSQTPEIL